jgi:hypothetical protein
MSTKNFTLRLIFIMGILLLIGSSGVYAQRGRGHSHWRGHSSYYGPRFHSYSRSYASIGFGFNARYHSGYYRPYHSYYRGVRPYFGFRIGVLPFGYHRIYVGAYPYYYYNGIYYSPYGNNDYRVVAPPLGAIVPELPGDAQDVIIDGQKYYVVDGTYYRQEMDKDNRIEYRVVGVNGVLNTDTNNSNPASDNYGSNIGDRINKLPADCRAVTIHGKKYYEAPSGIYYEEIISPNKIEYEVVGTPE